MKKPAILIINPLVASLRTWRYFSERGFAIVALLLQSDTPEYISKILKNTPWDYKIEGTGNIEADLEQVQQLQKDVPMVYGYIGCENAVEYGEKLLKRLFPDLSNDPSTSALRFDKYAMNECLREHNISSIKQLKIKDMTSPPSLDLSLETFSYPLVLKPNFNSAGAADVFFCDNKEDLLSNLLKFNHPALFGGSIEILLQEKISGEEYFVDTFSWQGQHHLSSIVHCPKQMNENQTHYHALTLLDETDPDYIPIFNYTKKVLDCLGVNFGFAHTEIIMTKAGDIKLIEINLRPSGMSGFINEVVFTRQQVNQYTLAADCLQNRTSTKRRDHKRHIIYPLKNYGFIYEKLNLDCIQQLDCFVNWDILIPRCQEKPTGLMITDSAAFIHLAHAEKNILENDLAQLIIYEQQGTVFL
jgi:biotin carboxylase